MSPRTRGVAVAVIASVGMPGSASRTVTRRRYSGRKSWPHSLMQWASSTASARTFQRASRARKSGSTRRSGATNRSRVRPFSRSASRRLASASSSDELSAVAATPAACSWSTWSFISAMSGETTTVRPSRTSAGSW